MSDLIDYAEKAGLENIKFRLQNAETLAKDSASTLTILLAGMGASMAYAIRGFEYVTPTPVTVGAAALAIWLMTASVLLVIFCIISTPLPVPTNEPLNLYQKDYSLDAIREIELRNLDARIKETAVRNHRVAVWLDRVRFMAILSPLSFGVTSLAWAAL